MRPKLIFVFLVFFSQIKAQLTEQNSIAKQNYLAELKTNVTEFKKDFYPNYVKLYSLPEKSFITKIDAARKNLDAVLNKYKSKFDNYFVQEQQKEIKYYFDKLLIDYPLTHDNYIGKTSQTASKISQKLKGNIADFNKPELLNNSDFTNYLKAFFHYQINLELKNPVYKNSDNQELDAVWKLIPRFISNPKCREFWQCDYLYNHIDNNGIKDIESIYANFKSTCNDTVCLTKVKAIYSDDSIGGQGHLTKIYKTVGSFNLDIHLFLPDSLWSDNKKPVIIYFHGGSWSEGKPDWFFYECKSDAKRGWVACAVEYRTSGRYGTLPFDAVMDAKSAIRWLRQHASEYNMERIKL